MIENMETKESAETVLSGIIDPNINSPVIMQDRPMNNRKKVENPKNTTSITSNKIPMINSTSWIEKNSCRFIKNCQFVRAKS